MRTIFACCIAVSVWAGPTHAPLGYELYLKMGANGSGDLVDNGGRFDGRMSSTAISNSNAGTLVNLWCVDAQLNFSYGASYRANSLRFNEINGESTTHSGPLGQSWGSDRDVRYEDVGQPGSNDWFRHGVGALANGSDGALFRYRMAAFLLDQYEANGSSLGVQTLLTGGAIGQGKYDPKNSTRNKAIIGAIWAAMDTQLDGDNRATPSSNVAFWFQTARNYVDTNWTNADAWRKWAIVSAWDNSCGGSPCYVRNSGSSVQTFLTETPEPGFYGVLSMGVAGLVLAARRRKS